jgi:hypothetical protein
MNSFLQKILILFCIVPEKAILLGYFWYSSLAATMQESHTGKMPTIHIVIGKDLHYGSNGILPQHYGVLHGNL